MKKLLLVGCILLSGAVVFGSEAAYTLDDLNDQFVELQRQEQELFEARKAEALEAQEKIKEQRVMLAEVTKREKALGGHKGEQYRDLAARYKEMKKEISAEIKANEKIVSEFNSLNKK